MHWKPLCWGILAGTLGIAACDGGNALGPDNQLQVTNNPDDFAIQATALDNISQTLSYTWQMTGTMANVDQSGSVASGSGTMTILDDAGTEVYTRSLAQTGSTQTSAGIAGAWTIRIQLDGMSGVLNVRVQKP
ncbi:MAG: hypothetical protein OEY20_11215 [Gemmatimonadota bacterium]|nr:hypothetical protein [Gemmatimonadota bacterium]MDH5197811.1 hypothetical protein [Gemmatimonadota bacterium]